MSEEKRCWACDSIVSLKDTKCPNCEMPLEEVKEEIHDIDSFLDDLSSDSPPSSSIDGEPAIPSFDDSPAIPSFDDGPLIPSFENEPTIPSFEETSKVSDSDPEPFSPSFDFDMPTIPDLEEGLTISDDEEEYSAQKSDILPLGAIPLKKQMKFFLPQLVYWSVVFTIISFVGMKIDDGNFEVGVYEPDQYTIRVELFIFGWISFVAMGWFFRYKSNQTGLMYSPRYGIIYLVLQLLMVLLTTLILLLVVNPTSDSIDRNTILTTHVYFIFYGFLISGLTFGFFLFFVGYKFYYDRILGLTPIAKL